ncbi:MAG: hypothetical protein RIR26_109 [Pseudomonadota bacterium]
MPQTSERLLQGFKILVVDDAADNRLLVSRFLTLSGAEVKAVASGAEGVSEAMNSKFNLILMDIQMPVMDGYEAVMRLRSKGCCAPIVALTAHAMPSERKRCLASGFNAYLTKPIVRQQLLETVAEWGRPSALASGDFTPIEDSQQGPSQQPARQAEHQNPLHKER